MNMKFENVAVIGGGGYVGSALVPELLKQGYKVKVIDLFIYGDQVFSQAPKKENLTCVKADIRNEEMIRKELIGIDAVIHLACVSNDPSFELDPDLGKSINYDSFPGVLQAAKDNKVKRFIFASSSSVYGLREEPNVNEESPCTPLTDYSKFKLMCEKLLKETDLGTMEYAIIRPATVCGYAPRLRLDLTVNILTIHALAKKQITIFGGSQLRPNIYITDMVRAYLAFLEAPAEKIHQQAFNIGFDNMTVQNIGELVKRQVNDPEVTLKVEPTNDLRSYHVNSDKVNRVLGFKAIHGLEDAVQSLVDAYSAGKIPDPLTNPIYSNIKTMQKINLKTTNKEVFYV